MDENKIISTIKDYISQYSQDVQITSGLQFNMKNTINKIKLYLNSKFASEGSQDRVFYNIVVPAIINSVKNTDIDTKDIIIKARHPKDRIKSLIYNELLRQWMDKKNFGLFINNINKYFTAFGSCVVKNIKDNDLKIIDLENIIMDPCVSNSDNSFELQSYYAIEKMYVTPDELMEMSGRGWSNVKEVIDGFKKTKKNKPYISEIEVYECYCYLSDELFGKGTDFSMYKIYTTCDQNVGKEVVFYAEKTDKMPYLKLDFETVEGIALGKGITQQLFDVQKRVNEIKNQMRESMKISSVHLFQTADETIEKNIMQDLRNGDIIKTSGMSPISSEERNLPAWNTELQTWTDNGRALTNAFEILTGEDLPSNITLGGQILQTQQGAKYFKIKRQELGMFLEVLLETFVLPQFESEIKPEEIVKITDTDTLIELVDRDVENRVNKAVIEYITSTGMMPEEEELEMIKEAEKEKSLKEKDFFVKATKKYFKFDKDLSIDITGEKDNLSTTINTKMQILNMPNLIGLMQDPATRNAVESLFEDVGFKKNLFSFKQQSQQEIPMQPQPQQGGQAPQSQVQALTEGFQQTAKPTVA